MCGLTATLIIDGEGIYDPSQFNDRLLLGLKGTLSEWELGVMRQRSLIALQEKAERGELYTTVPIGFLRTRDNRCEMDPDQRIQKGIRLVFEKFEELGSVRQVHLWFRQERVELPSIEYGPFGRSVVWKLPIYRTVHKFLTHPIYAGAYAFGRTRTETTVVAGHAKRRSGVAVAQPDWAVLIPEHHDGYIEWGQYQTNVQRISENAQMKGLMRRGAPRRGRSLLAGLLRCRRCGRRLHVTYSGPKGQVLRYGCRGAAINHGGGSCISFGGLAVDRAVEQAVLAVIQPGALEAAIRTVEQAEAERGRASELLSLKLEQARYEAERAHRQYNAVEPENRLVVAELERRWNRALDHVAEVEWDWVSLQVAHRQPQERIDRDGLLALAEDLPQIWNDPQADMRTKKRIVRTLIEELLVDVDDEAARIHLIVRWAGGQHTHLSVPKTRKGQHRYTTDRTVVDIVRELALMLPDGQIARVLNRLGLKTGHDNTWTAGRDNSLRHHHKIPVHDPEAPKREGLLTLEQAATTLKVSPPVVRRLLTRGLLEGRQIVPHAPWTIRALDLLQPAVQEYVERVHTGNKAPRTPDPQQLSIEPTTTS